jgi:hypothetical protein
MVVFAPESFLTSSWLESVYRDISLLVSKQLSIQATTTGQDVSSYGDRVLTLLIISVHDSCKAGACEPTFEIIRSHVLAIANYLSNNCFSSTTLRRHNLLPSW